VLHAQSDAWCASSPSLPSSSFRSRDSAELEKARVKKRFEMRGVSNLGRFSGRARALGQRP
jgi:hypothetical protein